MKPFVAVFLPLLIAYAGTLAWCVDRWNAPNGYFEHGWLVPIVFALVVWRRRATWRLQPAVPDARGLWLLVPALVVHLFGALLIIDSLSAMTLILAVPGAAWLALGRARLRGLWPALWLVAFLVPLPIFVEGRVAFTLKEVAVAGGSWLANLLGAGVVRVGDLLRPHGSGRGLFVAAACGGLRSLFAMATLAYCLAFFVGPATWRRRLTLLLLAAPLAIAANVVRIAALCLAAAWWSVDFAEGTGHTLANLAEWVVLLLLLVAADRWLSRGKKALPVAAATSPLALPAPGRQSVRTAVVLWLVAVPLAWLCFVRPEVAVGDRARRLPTTIAGYQLLPRSVADEAKFQHDLPQFRELLGTADFEWRYYQGPDGKGISLVALFHDHNWKSVHPPRICIEGSNMAIEQDDLTPAVGLDAGAVVSRIIARDRSSGVRFVTLSLFGTRDWMSGDYWSFAWHHLPMAWMRRNDSGFLLRVESRILEAEGEPAAEARSAAFLRELLPMARGLLR